MRKILVGMISALMLITTGICLYAEGETEETNEIGISPTSTVGVTLQDKIEDAIRNKYTYKLRDYDSGTIVIGQNKNSHLI